MKPRGIKKLEETEQKMIRYAFVWILMLTVHLKESDTESNSEHNLRPPQTQETNILLKWTYIYLKHIYNFLKIVYLPKHIFPDDIMHPITNVTRKKIIILKLSVNNRNGNNTRITVPVDKRLFYNSLSAHNS